MTNLALRWLFLLALLGLTLCVRACPGRAEACTTDTECQAVCEAAGGVDCWDVLRGAV